MNQDLIVRVQEVIDAEIKPMIERFFIVMKIALP